MYGRYLLNLFNKGAPPEMRNKAIVHQIGLNHHDLTLINCLVNMTPKINENFAMHNGENKIIPDVIIINADNEQAVLDWRKLKSEYSHIIPIMVTSSLNDIEDTISLKRPIVLKRLSAALDRVISMHSFTRTLIGSTQVDGKRVKRILIVDDSFPVRKYMELELLKLTQEKLLIDFASSGMEAKQKFEETKNVYDLVFLDVIMPDLDGYQVCKWIKSKYQTYVVMLTGKKSPIDKIRAVMSGSNNFLTKPPNQKRLQAIISKCFESVDKNTLDSDLDFNLSTEA